jgi:hypothetical protein
MINFEQWEGFEGRIWKEEVNVRDFIQKNYTPYDGDESFLAGPTEATDKLWGALQKLQKAERAKGGVLDMETEVVSSLTARLYRRKPEGSGADRGSADRQAPQARLHALRRHQDGRTGLHHLRLPAQRRAAQDLYRLYPHPQSGCV